MKNCLFQICFPGMTPPLLTASWLQLMTVIVMKTLKRKSDITTQPLRWIVFSITLKCRGLKHLAGWGEHYWETSLGGRWRDTGTNTAALTRMSLELEQWCPTPKITTNEKVFCLFQVQFWYFWGRRPLSRLLVQDVDWLVKKFQIGTIYK